MPVCGLLAADDETGAGVIMGRPINANKLWTPEERAELARLWEEGAGLAKIAKQMGRSGSAVVAQLVVGGYLYFSKATNGFHLTVPYLTMKQIQTVDKLMEVQSETAPPVADNLGNSPHA